MAHCATAEIKFLPYLFSLSNWTWLTPSGEIESLSSTIPFLSMRCIIKICDIQSPIKCIHIKVRYQMMWKQYFLESTEASVFKTLKIFIFYKCFSSSLYNLEVVDCQKSEFRELLHSSSFSHLPNYRLNSVAFLILSSFLTIRSQLLVHYLLRYLCKIHWFKRCYHVGECVSYQDEIDCYGK